MKVLLYRIKMELVERLKNHQKVVDAYYLPVSILQELNFETNNPTMIVVVVQGAYVSRVCKYIVNVLFDGTASQFHSTKLMCQTYVERGDFQFDNNESYQIVLVTENNIPAPLEKDGGYELGVC